jgi:hypothetical protein
MTRLLNLIQLRGQFERRAVHLAAEVLSWLVVGAGFELLGRHAPSDWVDLLAGAVLLGLAVAATGPPFRFRLPRLALAAVRWAGQRLEALFDAHYGADFHPERPPRLPRLRRYRGVILVLALANLAAAGVVSVWGSPLLAALRASYLLYLVLGALVWASLAVTLASLSLTLLQQLRLALSRARPRLDRRRVVALWLGLGIATAAFVQLDAWLGAAGWLAALALALLGLAPPRFGPAVEFRLNLRVRQAKGLPRLETTTVEEMVRSFLAILAILALVALLLDLVLQGHRLPLAPPVPEMASRLPLAHYPGRAAAWLLAAGTLLSTLLYLYEFTLRRRRSDPRFPGPVASERERVLELVRANLDLARASRRDRGEGFLFAPHWWPSDRMYRDSWHEDDLSEGSAGPDFQRHYGQPARRLLRRLLRALAIDLIYIEDGVPSAMLPRVFATLFHHYDATGGDQGGQAQALSERDLAAPPGVHLAVQEIELDVPAKSLGPYKEPSYESLSRARVLLILRPRGGEEEEAEDGDPFAWSREPGWVDRFLSRLPVAPGVPVG